MYLSWNCYDDDAFAVIWCCQEIVLRTCVRQHVGCQLDAILLPVSSQVSIDAIQIRRKIVSASIHS